MEEWISEAVREIRPSVIRAMALRAARLENVISLVVRGTPYFFVDDEKQER